MSNPITNEELADCIEEVQRTVPRGFIAYSMLTEAAARLREVEKIAEYLSGCINLNGQCCDDLAARLRGHGGGA